MTLGRKIVTPTAKASILRVLNGLTPITEIRDYLRLAQVDNYSRWTTEEARLVMVSLINDGAIVRMQRYTGSPVFYKRKGN